MAGEEAGERHGVIQGQVVGGGADEVVLAPAQAGSNGSNLVPRCLSIGSKDAMQQTSDS